MTRMNDTNVADILGRALRNALKNHVSARYVIRNKEEKIYKVLTTNELQHFLTFSRYAHVGMSDIPVGELHTELQLMMDGDYETVYHHEQAASRCFVNEMLCNKILA